MDPNVGFLPNAIPSQPDPQNPVPLPDPQDPISPQPPPSLPVPPPPVAGAAAVVPPQPIPPSPVDVGPAFTTSRPITPAQFTGGSDIVSPLQSQPAQALDSSAVTSPLPVPPEPGPATPVSFASQSAPGPDSDSSAVTSLGTLLSGGPSVPEEGTETSKSADHGTPPPGDSPVSGGSAGTSEPEGSNADSAGAEPKSGGALKWVLLGLLGVVVLVGSFAGGWYLFSNSSDGEDTVAGDDSDDTDLTDDTNSRETALLSGESDGGVEYELTEPSSAEGVSCPVTVAGSITGEWFFEAEFPLRLETENGEVLSEWYATATDDWMTEDAVPFEGELSCEGATGEVYLVLEKANPSDLPENADRVRIMITLSGDEDDESSEDADDESTDGESGEGEECELDLSAADLVEIELWESALNDTQGYGFLHPGWTETTSEDEVLTLEDDEADIVLSVRSGDMAVMGFEEYTIEDTSDVEVACQSATRTDFTNDDARLIVVEFEKDGVQHVITLNYTYVGASISSDIVEAFDLILKTVAFD